MEVTKRSQIREGKAKILYATDRPDEFIIQHFKDDATAFNALKKGTIRGKGAINNAVTSWIYPFLEKHGVPTHFVQKLSDREMLIKKVEIIPIEIVVRNRAAGGIVKRLGIPKGTEFKEPLFEFFYKSDELGDPPIGETHIAYFGWATKAELETLCRLAGEVNRQLKKVFREIGLDLIDFKLEFGREVKTGKILLADEFTPDGCRLWDLKTGEPMDKDRFRQDLGGVEEAYLEVFHRLEKYFSK